jgi:type VII secretion system ESX-1 substrate
MDELRVGTTLRELVPGDVEAILRLARRLRDIAFGCMEAADQLRGLKAGEWRGEAAEAFADALDQEPGKYARAAEAFGDAALAVERYAVTLEEAQHDARRAIALFEEATARHARAQTAEVARGSAFETVPPVEAEMIDPDILRARALLDDARERVQHEADIASRQLSDAAEAAPNKPGWGSRLLHGTGEFFGGVADATWGTGKFLWSVSQVRMVTDPHGWFHDVKGIREGLLWGVGHPVEFAKAITDWDTWLENPARAAGRLVPDIAIILATGGAGAAGRGARATEKAADVAEDLRAADRAADAADDARSANRSSHQPQRSHAMDEQRRLELQKDPDHNLKIREHSIKEAELAEDLEARRILPGLKRPMNAGEGDFVDPSGQHWDVKGPMSREAVEEKIRAQYRARGLPEPTFDPNRLFKGEFEIHDMMTNIREVIGDGMNVILDTRGLNDADRRVLREVIEQEGIGDRILWYP